MNLTFLFLGVIVGYLIGVFVDRYLLPVGDNIPQAFANRKTLQATEIQRDITVVEKEIGDIRRYAQQSEIHAIGFRHEVSDEIYDEYEEECCNKQIGFRRDKIR